MTEERHAELLEARLAEVEAERDALRSEVAAQVAMCHDCGEVETCDEDRCRASCGRDLLVFADRYSAELFTDGERACDDERDQLRSQVAEASQVLASALYGEERSGEQAHLPALARMMVDALTLEAANAEQARMQLDSGDDVDAATRRYLGEALGIAPPDDTPPSLSDFYDAVVEARAERDTAAAKERAAVVAWLRRGSSWSELDAAADAIEDGEHLETTRA